MTTRKHYKMLSEKDYELAKLLLDKGVRQSEVAKVTGRASGTVSVIFRTTNYAAYKEKIRMQSKLSLERRIANQNLEKDAVLPEDRTIDLEKETARIESTLSLNDNLKRIADAMEQLVYAWQNIPTSKDRSVLGFFKGMK